MELREYSDRSIYRRRVSPAGLVAFTVSLAESDLHVSARSDLSTRAAEALAAVRALIESHMRARPEFGTSLVPLPPDPAAPGVISRMLEAGRLAGTGPMAAVAGAVSGAVGRALMASSPDVIVENGGDLFVAGCQPRLCAVFAGESKLSMKLGVRVPAAEQGLGVCTSSGTVGPSLSRGRADAALVISADECLADAAATELGNRVRAREDLESAIGWVRGVEGVAGALAILGEDLAAWGEIELVEI